MSLTNTGGTLPTVGGSTNTWGTENNALHTEWDKQILREYVIALSDEGSTISTGTAKVTWRAPHALTIKAVRASLTDASSSGVVTFDINEAGSSILSTKLTIDEGEKTSTTAATAAVISDTSIANDAEITIDIDGAGTGAKGAKVTIYAIIT